MQRVILAAAEESKKKALKCASKVFTFDFRWAKRRQAKQGTGTLIDFNSNKVT